MLTAADDNRDGMLQEAEMKSPMFQPVKANFAAIDTDKSGALSFQEAGVAMKQMMEQRVRENAGRRQ